MIFNVDGQKVVVGKDGMKILYSYTEVVDYGDDAEKYNRSTLLEYDLPMKQFKGTVRIGDDYYIPPKNTSFTALTLPDEEEHDLPAGVLVRIPKTNKFLEKIRENVENFGDPTGNFKRPVKILYTKPNSVFDNGVFVESVYEVGDYIIVFTREETIAYSKEFGLDGAFITTPENVLNYAAGKEFVGTLREGTRMNLLPYLLMILYQSVKTKQVPEDYKYFIPEITVSEIGGEFYYSYNEIRMNYEDYSINVMRDDTDYWIKSYTEPGPNIHDIIITASTTESIQCNRQKFAPWMAGDHYGFCDKGVYVIANKLNVPLVDSNYGYRIERSKIIFYGPGITEKTLYRDPKGEAFITYSFADIMKALSKLPVVSKEKLFNDILKLPVYVETGKAIIHDVITPNNIGQLEDMTKVYREFEVL